jgi:hypothetical protein
MRRTAVWLLAATVLALPACSAGTQPAPNPSAPGPSFLTSAPPASSGGQPSPLPSTSSPVLVRFGRQGGLAGLSDQLTVRQDGGFTLVRRRPALSRSGQLSQADLAELRQVLTQAHLATLPRVEPAQGADLFTYQVIYDGSEILAMDGGMVDALKPLVGLLSGIVDRYSR